MEDLSFLDEYNMQLKDISKVNKVLSKDKKVKVETRLFPFIELAENGDIEALTHFRESFTYGETGVTKSEAIARHYHHLVSEYITNNPDSLKLYDLKHHYDMEYIIADEFGDTQELYKAAQQVAKFMVNNYPPNEWNFIIFSDMETILSRLESEQNQSV